MVIVLLVGLLFAALGSYGTRRQILLRRKGQRVTGTVTRIDRQWNAGGGPDGAGTYSYTPVLSFETLSGQQIETRSQVGNSSLVGLNAGAKVGQSVPVIYDPANPDVAEIDTVGAQTTALLLPLVSAVAGIGLAVAGIVTMTRG